MVRLVNCIRKRNDVPLKEFRRHWDSDEFDELIQEIATFYGAKGFAKNATLQVEANLWILEQSDTREPYEGTLEYWWDNAAGLAEKTLTMEARALGHRMLKFQSTFVDQSGCTRFFTEADKVMCPPD